MNKTVVHKKGTYSFNEGLKRAKERPEYYEEGLLVDTAARLIEAMDARNVTRSELAKRLGVSAPYVTKVLRGQANLSLESLAKLAFALDMKWECVLIPKKARIGVLSVTHESGPAAIRTVETATIEGTRSVGAADEYAHDQEKRYEGRLSVPA